MASSLSSLTDNLIKGLLNIKFKDCKACLEYVKVNVTRIVKTFWQKVNKNICKHI